MVFACVPSRHVPQLACSVHGDVKVVEVCRQYLFYGATRRLLPLLFNISRRDAQVLALAFTRRDVALNKVMEHHRAIIAWGEDAPTLLVGNVNVPPSDNGSRTENVCDEPLSIQHFGSVLNPTLKSPLPPNPTVWSLIVSR